MPEITGFFFAVVIAWLYRRPDAARIWRRLRKPGSRELEAGRQGNLAMLRGETERCNLVPIRRQYLAGILLPILQQAHDDGGVVLSCVPD
jgi:hypothetical protein